MCTCIQNSTENIMKKLKKLYLKAFKSFLFFCCISVGKRDLCKNTEKFKALESFENNAFHIYKE